MGFEKGKSGNPLGRPKNSKNKATTKIREHFKLFLEDNLERMRDDFDSLSPEQRIKYSIEIAKFVLPTLKSVELESTLNKDAFKPIEIIIDNDN